MTGLRPPPKRESPSRVLGRILTLVLLLIFAGVVIYAVTTNQRIDLAENVRIEGLELEAPSTVDGLTINVVEEDGSGTPVLLLHHVDVTGGLLLAEVARALPEGWRGVRVDLPGFGYSDRMPTVGQHHTVAGMAERLVVLLEDRFDQPVVVAGVGFGGEVAAEIAFSRPDLVTGLVMVDTDFADDSGLRRSLETLPLIGRAATYTWETGGRFAVETWAPYCEGGGWCPSPEQLGIRAFVVALEDTTDSMHAFLRTPAAALAGSNLDDLDLPAAYVWSSEGELERDAVDRIVSNLSQASLHESISHQAHLEDVATVVGAITGLGG